MYYLCIDCNSWIFPGAELHQSDRKLHRATVHALLPFFFSVLQSSSPNRIINLQQCREKACTCASCLEPYDERLSSSFAFTSLGEAPVQTLFRHVGKYCTTVTVHECMYLHTGGTGTTCARSLREETGSDANKSCRKSDKSVAHV